MAKEKIKKDLSIKKIVVDKIENEVENLKKMLDSAKKKYKKMDDKTKKKVIAGVLGSAVLIAGAIGLTKKCKKSKCCQKNEEK